MELALSLRGVSARGTDRHTKINIIDLPVSNLITRGGAMLTSVGESPAT